MGNRRHWILAGVMVSGGVAWGGPGAMGVGEVLELIDPGSTGRACVARGGVCVSPGGSQTTLVETKVASAAGRKGAAPAVPSFARAAKGDEPWTIEIDALLSKPAVQGNALFLFYDLEDPNAVAEHEVTMMQQKSVQPGRAVAARVRLSTEEGFVGGHSYRVQVVQLIGGKELVLAQGDFALK